MTPREIIDRIEKIKTWLILLEGDGWEQCPEMEGALGDLEGWRLEMEAQEVADLFARDGQSSMVHGR